MAPLTPVTDRQIWEAILDSQTKIVGALRDSDSHSSRTIAAHFDRFLKQMRPIIVKAAEDEARAAVIDLLIEKDTDPKMKAVVSDIPPPAKPALALLPRDVGHDDTAPVPKFNHEPDLADDDDDGFVIKFGKRSRLVLSGPHAKKVSPWVWMALAWAASTLGLMHVASQGHP